jgi:preprotein translocase subunit SecY
VDIDYLGVGLVLNLSATVGVALLYWQVVSRDIARERLVWASILGLTASMLLGFLDVVIFRSWDIGAGFVLTLLTVIAASALSAALCMYDAFRRLVGTFREVNCPGFAAASFLAKDADHAEAVPKGAA